MTASSKPKRKAPCVPDASTASKDATTAADFETAIDVAGFGTFNVLLLLVALPAAVGTVFETSTMSYILPSAECDLKLTLLDKGILNAITYAGMITSAVAWGYLADTKGRKNILVLGYLLNAICVVGGASSQNVVQLMIFKYFGGFIMCGPFAVLMSYLTELHGRKYRPRVMILIGMMFTVASLMLPLLALTILPNNWNYQLMGLNFHSWQVFLAVSAIPSLLSGTLIAFFPESPKFLMSQGRNTEALEVFRTIYALNKHKPRGTYPIKELLHEVPQKNAHSDGCSDSDATTIATIEGINAVSTKGEKTERASSDWLEGFRQLRPLFKKPYLGYSLHVYLMNFCVLLGQNTVRLWLPQLFASISEFEQTNSAVISMCSILEYNVNKTATVVESSAANSCEVHITAASYTNNIIVALAGFCGYLLAGSLVNLIGVKRILTIASFIAGSCGVSMYFAASSMVTLILASIFVTMGSITATSVISASVNLFPTSLRTMIVSLEMMFGRCGSLLGNIMFPMLMSVGCIPPFVMIAFVMFFASLLSAFLPNMSKASLK